MKLQATHYVSLIPEQERSAFIGPQRIPTYVTQFLVTRGLERNRNVPAPTNAFITVIWCTIVVNLCDDLQLRESVRSQLLSTPCHEIVTYVDQYFPVNGRTLSTGNFPLRIRATNDALAKVRTAVNNGGFNFALRKVADYLNLAGVSRTTASADIVNNASHSAITSIHCDAQGIFPSQPDENVTWLTLHINYDSSAGTLVTEMPHYVVDVQAEDKDGKLRYDKEGEPIMEEKKVFWDHNKVAFFTQSTDKSGFSTSRPVLTSFSTFLIVDDSLFSEVAFLLGLKMGYTFTASEEQNCMYQLINQAYGPTVKVQEARNISSVRAVPKLPQSEGPNYQEQNTEQAVLPQSSQSVDRPIYPPQGQGRVGGKGRGKGRDRRDVSTSALPRGKESYYNYSGYGQEEIDKIAQIVLMVIKALKLQN